ncbi:MAG: phosphoethanolamine transferase CptA [Betaproteobacteria bacterium]|nr:phosphoethanolamine transferase CptA [Betaproteobacteria bacterium]
MMFSAAQPGETQSRTQSFVQRVDWAGLFWLYLFFWYFSGVLQTLLLPTAGIHGFRGAFFMSFIWLAPVLLLPQWTRQIAATIGVILWISSMVSLGYWGIYGSEFSQSVIFTIFETNAEEATEYLSQYASFSLVAGLVFYTLIAWLLWWRVRPFHLPRAYAASLAGFVLLANFGSPYVDCLNGNKSFAGATRKLYRRMEPAAPWQFITGYLQYQNQLNSVQRLLDENASMSPLKNITDASGGEPRTLVLVIGESTTSTRMSLYGYPRKTTPRLDALQEKGELLAFANVITSRPYTIEALQHALSFAHPEEPGRFFTEPNLMNLMKQAGYKTFWLTNQQTMTKRNTLLTFFSRQADEARYLNQHRVQNATLPDEVVFEPFTEILSDSAPRKFIVVHLMGTHSKYPLRYPQEYKQFTGREHVPEVLSNSLAEVYNSYDNAILYNDFVISSLIDLVAKSQTSRSLLLYFSDHGEEAYHAPPHQKLGRDENQPTVDMFAIPFMLWMSPAYKESLSSDLAAFTERKYSNAHFIHTWSDLAGLHYDRFQPELSLVNPEFKAHKRWIGNPDVKASLRDFDQLFPASR